MAETQTPRPLTLEANLGLVRKVAHRYASGVEDLASFDDLCNEGVLGLNTAIQRFDPEKGYKFSTYACWCIRGAITHYLRDKCAPGGMKSFPRNSSRHAPLSLDVFYGEGDSMETFVDILPGRDYRDHWILSLVEMLPENNRLVIERRYFEGLSLAEQSRRYRVSLPTLSKRHQRALVLLRKEVCND